MVFVTLGSQKFQFNRLLQAIDALIEDGVIQDEVFAQTGDSDYVPKHFEYKPFLDRDAFARYMEKADAVITHGGTGAIIGALKNGKRVIAVSRLSKYGEHVDDHQLQIIEEFEKQNFIFGVRECDELRQAWDRVFTHEFNRYVSNTERYILEIEKFIEGINGGRND